MRKLYALLAGLFIGLAGIQINAQPTPDSCTANFTQAPVTPTPLGRIFTAIPWHNNQKRPEQICWQFGDGRDTCINYNPNQPPPPNGYSVYHQYNQPGNFNVCVSIRYQGGCQAHYCRSVQIGNPDSCTADFERIPVTPTNNPLQATFHAIPWHNQNNRPVRICWEFGDGRDTCINYSNTNPGPYNVNHTYTAQGSYEVCVKILYQGGCEARKCKTIQIGQPDSCRADFIRLPVNTTANPLTAVYKALPWHNNNKKPSRICWTFGDGRDTCINYSNIYVGQYLVPHTYQHPGLYEVCVKIRYHSGCEARTCKPIQVGRPDTCHADFERIPATANNPLRAYFRALPLHNNNKKPQKICWTFGDGRDTCINYTSSYTGQYIVAHNYQHNGLYEVCVKILYFGGCEARKCKHIQVGERPDSCRADFERIPANANNPLRAYFRALPLHNNNKKPQKICWTFGDGRDTCITYPSNYTGQYIVAHNYQHRGLYEVCVKILYYGGCEARKCRPVQVGEHDSCSADFERLPGTTINSLTAGFRALPWNNHQRKPARICWTFGDGRDTCINYTETYNGAYTVTHTYPHAGPYEVCVKILYYGGCEARKCKPIIIQPNPNQTCAVHLFEITPSINSLVRGFFASPSSVPNRRPENICWYFGDGRDTCYPISLQNPLLSFFINHTYPGPGVYRACVKITFQGGCIAYDCREVVIRNNTNVCGGYMTDSLIGPRIFKFKGFSIHNPNDEAISYRWTFGDGTTALGREVTHTYNQAGNYEICLTILTRRGCETRICKTIHVPGTNQSVLQLSPNPVINVLHVQFFSTHTEQINIKILNATGTPVRNYIRNVTAGINNWDHDLSSLLPGIYSYMIQSPNQFASAIFLKQ